ncbi:alpha-beta hydrolase superfamily lysophospholipase [Clostridium algifaecis]|uniref:Alpha-beta hydrolase superfamily lysophospholipase n=2 Tax=Clostridium algifaecis TaxID=1472040 RepID=A0ABS4KSD4_9CLOT|nr:alpha-beta hydrolase superfamily lysophospholipase [Clostridium algifaecis]
MCMGDIEYKSETFFYKDQQGVKLFTQKWFPCDKSKIKGVIQIAHGMGETTNYYREFSENMVKAGFAVYINEARGHGRTAGDISDSSYAENAGYMGDDGITWMVEDIKLLTDIIKIENPGVPNFLLGHSLGSVLAQIYAYKYGSEINGIIYSGTTGPIDRKIIKKLVKVVEKEVIESGRKAPSIETANYFFKHYNDKFQPAKTDCDWLTSDSNMLEDTLSSPYAAIDYKVGYYEDFINALKNLHRERFIKKIPKELPVFSISGSDDPFGNYGESIKTLFKMYKKLGIKDTTYKIYESGRHEMLREVNRYEVIEDLQHWLCNHI